MLERLDDLQVLNHMRWVIERDGDSYRTANDPSTRHSRSGCTLIELWHVGTEESRDNCERQVIASLRRLKKAGWVYKPLKHNVYWLITEAGYEELVKHPELSGPWCWSCSTQLPDDLPEMEIPENLAHCLHGIWRRPDRICADCRYELIKQAADRAGDQAERSAASYWRDEMLLLDLAHRIRPASPAEPASTAELPRVLDDIWKGADSISGILRRQVSALFGGRHSIELPVGRHGVIELRYDPSGLPLPHVFVERFLRSLTLDLSLAPASSDTLLGLYFKWDPRE